MSDDEGIPNSSLSFLLRILDRYPLQLPVKGTSAIKAWHTVFITSNFKPEDCYVGSREWNQAREEALNRRITHLIRLSSSTEPVYVKNSLPLSFQLSFQ